MPDIVLYGKLYKIKPFGKRGSLLHSDRQTHDTHTDVHADKQRHTLPHKDLKDIISKADDVGQFEGDICLIRDPQVVHKRLQTRQTHSVIKILYILYIHTCVKRLSKVFSRQEDTHITPSYTDYKQEYEFNSSHGTHSI